MSTKKSVAIISSYGTFDGHCLRGLRSTVEQMGYAAYLRECAQRISDASGSIGFIIITGGVNARDAASCREFLKKCLAQDGAEGIEIATTPALNAVQQLAIAEELLNLRRLEDCPLIVFSDAVREEKTKVIAGHIFARHCQVDVLGIPRLDTHPNSTSEYQAKQAKRLEDPAEIERDLAVTSVAEQEIARVMELSKEIDQPVIVSVIWYPDQADAEQAAYLAKAAYILGGLGDSEIVDVELTGLVASAGRIQGHCPVFEEYLRKHGIERAVTASSYGSTWVQCLSQLERQYSKVYMSYGAPLVVVCAMADLPVFRTITGYQFGGEENVFVIGVEHRGRTEDASAEAERLQDIREYNRDLKVTA